MNYIVHLGTIQADFYKFCNKAYTKNGRMYDPALGRFLSPDPFMQDPSNTQNFNRYSYCLNNPLKFIDPSGFNYTGHPITQTGIRSETAGGTSYNYGWEYAFDNNNGNIENYFNLENYNNLVNAGSGFGLGDVGIEELNLILENIILGINLIKENIYEINFQETTQGGAFFLIFNYIENSDYFSGASKPEYGYLTKLEADFVLKYLIDYQFGSTKLSNKSNKKVDYSGFLGKLDYFWNGGIKDGYQYDLAGNCIGIKPNMGNPPVPSFKGGSMFIKGFGSVDKHLFHSIIKKDILTSAGDFYKKVVGSNPDVAVKKGLIILKGTGPYSGKVYQTDLNALDFFDF